MFPRTTFWACLAVATLLRTAVAALLPLTLNEPYYWLWARHPALGYYDHPPLAAWLSSILAPLGSAPLVVRTPALLCGAACAILVYAYTRRLTGDDDAATVAGVALLCAPYYSVMSVLAWPEFALLATWAWTLLAWHEALFGARPSTLRWVHAGIALGFCLLAKFTSFAVVAGLVLFFMVSPSARQRHLRSGGPATALAVALLVYSPFLAWNATHGWQTFLFQAKERSHGGPSLHLEHIPNFVAETLGGLSPLIALALVPAALEGLRRAFRDADGEPLRLPLAISLPPLLVFWALVPLGTVQVYWTLCCYLGLFPFLGTWLVPRLQGAQGRAYRLAGVVGMFVALLPMLLAVAAVAQPRLLFSVSGRAGGNGVTELYAFDDLAAVLDAERLQMRAPERTFFGAEDHRLASHLLLRQERAVLMFSGDQRGMEFLRWESPEAHAGEDCVVLMRKPFPEDREGLHRRLLAVFDTVEAPVAHVVRWNGLPAQTFYTVRCLGFHPERPRDSTSPSR